MILLLFIFITLFAFYNYYFIVDKQKEWHFVGGLLRGLTIIIILTYNLTEFSYNTVYMIVGATLLNWVVYDAILNILREKSLFYRGKNTIDSFIKSDCLYICAKLAALIIGIILFML